jgi:integrase
MKISILNNGGNIRLKYRYGNKYELISLGLAYNQENLEVAKLKAEQIKNDIIFNRYEGREKYLINPKPKEDWNFPKILDYYLASRNHDASTINSVKILKEWCGRSPSRFLFPERIDEWVLYLKREIPRLDGKGCGLADSTISAQVKILRASLYFAYEMNKIPKPKLVAKVCKLVKTKVKKEIKVYSVEEINTIIDAFTNNPRHNYYAQMVHFRFLTGTRPSETVALTWDDVIYDDNKTYIRVNKRYVNGVLKDGLKNNKPYRYIPCNSQLQLLLSQIPRSNYLMFPAVNGGYINTENFVKRHWNPVLDGLLVLGKIKFKIKFYDERHCFGTLVCRQVSDLKTVANIMGNSPMVLQKHYLANDNDFELPEF